MSRAVVQLSVLLAHVHGKNAQQDDRADVETNSSPETEQMSACSTKDNYHVNSPRKVSRGVLLSVHSWE